MNAGAEPSLLLVMSGSHQDKLMQLTNSPAAPFWGSRVELLPPLDDAYVDWCVERLETELPALKPLDRASLRKAFVKFGQRPQFLMNALKDAIGARQSETGSPDWGNRISADVHELAGKRQQTDREGFASTYLQLESLEQAVLWRLLSEGLQFRPYDAAAMKFYKERIGKTTTAGAVQRKLEALREKNPPLLWKSQRGEYSPYDQSLQAWYNFEKNRGSWPPTPTSS